MIQSSSAVLELQIAPKIMLILYRELKQGNIDNSGDK